MHSMHVLCAYIMCTFAICWVVKSFRTDASAVLTYLLEWGRSAWSPTRHIQHTPREVLWLWWWAWFCLPCTFTSCFGRGWCHRVCVWLLDPPCLRALSGRCLWLLDLPVSEPGVGPVCGSLALPVSESGVGCASPVYCRQAVTPSLALSHCCGVRHQLGNSYAGWSLPLIFPCVDCMYS